MLAAAPIDRLPFAAVNRRGFPDYREGWNRHHLQPVQCMREALLAPFVSRLGEAGFFLDDFNSNGVMLPALDSVSRMSGLPLHVGGHPAYNRRVILRMQDIRLTCELVVGEQKRVCFAIFLMRQLQAELRHAILNQGAETLDHMTIRNPAHRDREQLIDLLFAARAARSARSDVVRVKKSAAPERPHFLYANS